MRTAIKSVEQAVASGEKAEAQAAMQNAQEIINRVASKGVIKKEQASRRVSRLMKKVNQVGA